MGWVSRFRLFTSLLAVLAAMVFFPCRPAPADLSYPPIPQIPLNEKVIRIPVEVPASGKPPLLLEATQFLPDGPGPFPLLVLSHGTPRNAAERLVRQRFEAQSWVFVNLGFAVVIPMRRGYGRSEGSYAEEEGECDRARYYEAGLASARDLLAAVRFMKAQPYIDQRRIVLGGHSSGGFASLALAGQGFPGLLGVLNFSGGRGAKADKLCDPPALIDAFAKFGRSCRVPTLWLYAENDTYFPPPLVRRLHQAFVKEGGQAQMVMLRPFLYEGHDFFFDVRGLDLWRGTVKSFLNGLRLDSHKTIHHEQR
jgi:dienelactone hydrolase